MWRFSTFSEFAFYVLLLLALLPTVNSNEIPTPRMCALCLEKDCANGVRKIYPADGDTAVWSKANSRTGIQNCSMENLKPDAPCKMANGSLIQLGDNPLEFEGIDSSDVRRVFTSENMPCADLNLPFKPSLMTKAPIHITSNPAATNDSGIAIPIGIISSIIIFFIIFIISIRVLIWKYNSRGQGKDGERHGNNGVPPHDAEDRDENTMEKQPLKGEVPNGNFNGVHREDDSVGTAGLLGHCDHTPV